MEGSVHMPPDDAKHIYRWYRRAQVDYVELFVRLYIAYNAWYRQVTGSTNDRQAINQLKKRFIIWDDYCNGRAIQNLRVYLKRLSVLTVEQPFTNISTWDGVVVNDNDWRSLIEFWYQVRCALIHGSEVPSRYVWLAYETLEVFMGEIVQRMQSCFTEKDLQRLEELSTLVLSEDGKSSRFRRLQWKLQAKYIESPDIWQVDMQRVR